MTTDMNFGPKWMRTNNTKSSEILTSLLPSFEEQHHQQQQQENPFKYSKDFMLSLYKANLHLPANFNKHEYVTTDKIMAPLATEELSDLEKKALNYVTGGTRLGQRKARTGDYFGGKDQPLKRSDSDLLKRRDQKDELILGKLDDESVNWNSKGGFNTFSAGGNNNTSGNLFGDNEPFKSSTEALFSGANDLGGLSNIKKPENTKWYYRDPSGQVQGPFEAQEMQDWYKAGFFTPTLMLRRDDETIFEPLMLLTQKVGNEDTPFLAPRPRLPISAVNTPGADLFGGTSGTDLFASASDRLFGNDKYMPFGGAPTTPSGNFSNNAPTTPLYQSPYNGNSLLRDNRWDQQSQPSPTWLNSNSTSELFGAPVSPFTQQPQQSLNPMFGGGMNSPSLFDYQQRPVTDQIDQHQQYMNILQQNQQQQQQRTMPFQQQLQTQQQFQPNITLQQPQQHIQNQEPSPQAAFKNLTLDNISNVSNHASPVLKSSVLASTGWGSPAPGTPIGEVPTSPWGSIVSAAIPTKVSEELQSKAPGAQSPRAPSSPKKAIEKPVKVKTVIESFADIQLEEEKKAAAAAAASASAAAAAAAAVVAATPVSVAPVATPATPVKEEPVAPKIVSTPKVVPTQTKPVVSLREIQQEELRIANEKKAKQAKAMPSPVTSGPWAVQTPVSIKPNLSAAWTAPSGPKKTLREIQQEEELAMKKKNAKASKTIASTTTAAAIAAANAPTSTSRAYAVTPSAGGAWTTVTNTRTPKPTTSAPAAPVVTTPVVREPVRWEPVVKPAAPKPRSGPSEDFRRWCKKALRDLNSGVNQEEIVDMLVSFPVDANASEIIEDVIYANSLRIDGKRFAQEFMKRRKADIAGRLDIVTAGLEDEDEDDFKVVIKKGKKKAL
ncbi:unnamed protein product [Mucor hiemalis]